MRTPRLRSVLFLVLLVAVLAAAAAGLGGAGKTPAAQAGPATAASHWCNFVLAGKNATADGSVLMGYNNDWSANNYVYLQVVPGDATHYQYVKLYTWGGVPEGGINEHQLGALYGTATDSRQDRARRRPVREEGLRRRDLGPHPAAVHDGAAGHHPARPDGADRVQLRRRRQLRGRRSAPGVALRVARRPSLGRPAGARQRLPRPPQHGDRSARSTWPTRPTSAARPISSPSPRASAATARRTARSTSPGPTATAPTCSPTTTPTVSGAPSTRSPRRSASPPTMPYATRPVYVVPDHKLTRQEIADHLPLPLRGHEHRPDAGLHADEPARPDQPAHLLLDHRLQRRVAAALRGSRTTSAASCGSRRAGRARAPTCRSTTRSRVCPTAWTSKTAYNLVPRRRRQPRQERDRGRRDPLQALHPAGEEHLRGVRDRLHERAGEPPRARRPASAAQRASTYLTNYSSQRATQAQNLAAGCRRRCRERSERDAQAARRALLDARLRSDAARPRTRSARSCTRRCARRRPAT